ncbi:hypothetical protein M6D81_17270 [Paenibacillus sp. J5C_2022]|uniref:hypothetical protein n=1 Tax=Paenibacillus sp. J5C2022 TaxID=2977129 RepID=UPI0021D0AAFF|nr:hypothetical protein [Paenibacillus sp. J5C2022]MCU6710446.1 hypothetical protein [Paenibacillus sp. J5C2022]
MKRKKTLYAASILLAFIVVNNGVYYYQSKSALEEQHRQELHTWAKQMEVAVEQSRLGADMFEDQMGRELRTAAIAAQYALDPDVEKVTNEQLAELSKKLDIAHLTLLKQTEDDIVLYRSSDSTQLGRSTKQWDPWHDIFKELFRNRQTTVDWLGQTLDNFWSGPYEVSSTDLDKIYKWGYYHDGMTNYIVDPYIGFQRMDEYNEITGVQRLIDELIAASPSLLEVAVINPGTFPEGVVAENDLGEPKENLVQRPVLYGGYTYKTERDERSVQQAHQSGETVAFSGHAQGRPVYKLFVPVNVKEKGIHITDENGGPMDSYVLSVVSDYALLQKQVRKQMFNLGTIVLTLSGLGAAAAIVAIDRLNRSGRKRNNGEYASE